MDKRTVGKSGKNVIVCFATVNRYPVTLPRRLNPIVYPENEYAKKTKKGRL